MTTKMIMYLEGDYMTVHFFGQRMKEYLLTESVLCWLSIFFTVKIKPNSF